MSWERRFERPQRPEPELPPELQAHGRRFNPAVIIGIAAFAVTAFYILIAVAALLYPVLFPGNDLLPVKVSPFESDNPAAAETIEDRINILVMGLDRRVGVPEDTAARTDTVFILTIDPFSKTAGILSIPRDAAIEIPDGFGGYYSDRINVVWQTGEYVYHDYPGGGPGLIKDAIEHNFDIPIDNYVIIDFADFIDLIDEVGGIDVDVPEYVADFNYGDGASVFSAEFAPGPQHMDGTTALAYARIRKGSNDFKRIERQQLVIQATAEKAANIDLLNPSKLIGLYNGYKDAVDTDISDLRIPGLGKLAQQIGTKNIRMVSLAEATYPCGPSCGGAAILLLDWDKVEELKALVFSDGKIQSEDALVELQNGSETIGLAEEFAGFIRKQGIPEQQLLLGDAAQIYTRTLIIDRSGKEYTAKKLAEWLDLPSDRIISAGDPGAADFAAAQGDIVIVLGTDAQLPSATLSAGN